MKSVKEFFKSVGPFINKHELLLVSSALMFAAMVFYLYFTQNRLIDADTAVAIPTFLIAGMTIAWNLAHLWVKKGDENYWVLTLTPIVFIVFGLLICAWLARFVLSDIKFVDWCNIVVTPIVTFVIGIAQPMLNDFTNPKDVSNNSKMQKIVFSLLYIASFILLCITS